MAIVHLDDEGNPVKVTRIPPKEWYDSEGNLTLENAREEAGTVTEVAIREGLISAP